MSEPDFLKFHLEVHADGVPREVFELAVMLRDDPNASLRERQMAWLIIKLATTVNKLISELETGTTTLVVHESNMRRD